MNQVFQRFLALRLRVQEFFLLLEKPSVASRHTQQPLGISPVQFRHFRGDVLKKVAIVAHNHAGEGCSRQQGFQPLDSRQVEMIRRFIQQQDVWSLNQRLDDREPFLPAT
jgi:hypothetical protein